jgi:hypothetical protein
VIALFKNIDVICSKDLTPAALIVGRCSYRLSR